MIHMCDVVLTFLLIATPSNSVREIYTTQMDVPKYLAAGEYGQLVNVKTTKPFDCKKGPGGKE